MILDYDHRRAARAFSERVMDRAFILSCWALLAFMVFVFGAALVGAVL